MVQVKYDVFGSDDAARVEVEAAIPTVIHRVAEEDHHRERGLSLFGVVALMFG
jgi:hypothetical protein